ncbi:seryl-tRNA(Sec) selenium transferase [Halobacteroides halobius DSM 5150]|uniref:L-seryl-tRNA(Sec) selenium transferase n=1 Tax=Halobacteroides halobius (strain ATCC 35273 / DSM 5150 / MD-1) TaxID=748449 RepID=L0K9S4_HALHC|nr:L-seryl-tRNA(Sec) selenium transferase [Halobacteroides halobius]AGB42062.1 seryl-tRNA(Sec) selenium transferase [Halobacteroides halobius DSM 5150]
MNKRKQGYLRKIPAVNDLLAMDLGQKLINDYPRQLVVEGIREVTDKLRKQILDMELKKLNKFKIKKEEILDQVKEYLVNKTSDQLKAVVNATGVVVHTNLGRSLLCDAAKEKLQQVASKYSTLEINRESGERGSRYEIVEELLTELTGAEAALVVNNNASAVLLALSSLAQGKEAIIARGQLVEIGGSFRIPDVMKQSGVKLAEVGTTNRVHLADYKRAINEKTGVLLKVHTSNYEVVGFTKEVSLKGLVELGSEHGVPVVEDLGSGILVDLTPWGLSYEPTVQDSIKAGADVVTFSGDKLLGGPQAGIIVGKKEYIDQMKTHSLNRALRVDKFTLGALEATLQEYREIENARREIPTLQMLTVSEDELKKRAEKLAAKIKKVISLQFELKVEQDISRAGGGAFPTEELTTYVIKLAHQELSAEEIAERLRLNNPPVFTRISKGNVLLDLRTLQDEDFAYIVEALDSIRG